MYTPIPLEYVNTLKKILFKKIDCLVNEEGLTVVTWKGTNGNKLFFTFPVQLQMYVDDGKWK